jgi:hypothetical protein
MTKQKNDAYAALRVRDFRWFLLMRLMTTLTVQIMSVSVGYYVYELTGDPLMLGLIGLAEAVPAIGISLWAGHLADKYNKRNILAICLSVLVLCSGSLLTLAYWSENITKSATLGILYGDYLLHRNCARIFQSYQLCLFIPDCGSRSAAECHHLEQQYLGSSEYHRTGHRRTDLRFCRSESHLHPDGHTLFTGPHFDADTTKAFTQAGGGRVGGQAHCGRTAIRFQQAQALIIAAIAMDLFAGAFLAVRRHYCPFLPKISCNARARRRPAYSALRCRSEPSSMASFSGAPSAWARESGKSCWPVWQGLGSVSIASGLSTNFYLLVRSTCLVAGMLDEVSVFIRAALLQFQTPDNMRGARCSGELHVHYLFQRTGCIRERTCAGMGTVPAVVFGGLMTMLVVGITWWKAPTLPHQFILKKRRRKIEILIAPGPVK